MSKDPNLMSKDPNLDLDLAEIENGLDAVARRVRAVAHAIDEAFGELIASADREDVSSPLLEIYLAALRTEAAEVERFSEILCQKRRAQAVAS